MPFSRSPRPGGSTTGTARRVPMPGRRTAAPRDDDRRPPVSPASAGPRGSGRPASTTPPHDAKRDSGTADAAPRGAARQKGRGAPELADRRPPPEGWWGHPCGMVGPGRLERPTSRLSGVRSDRLSYGPAPDAPGGRRGGLGEGTGGRRGPACHAPRGRGLRGDLRKEVIQPQVPLRLPCYDFTPVADLTVDGCLRASAVSPPASGRANSHGVTGGVYKARERIHRGVLIRDY